MRYLVFFTWLCCLISTAFAQDKYWISFTDKGDLSQAQRTVALSPEALANRAVLGIPLDETDYAVNPAYLTGIMESAQVKVLRTSRWFNAASANLTFEQYQQIDALPYVADITPVRSHSTTLKMGMTDECPETPYVGTAARQLTMLKLDRLHANGLTGKGVRVAVFDNGYYRVDSLEAFEHIFEENRIVGAYDFVDNDDDVFNSCVHCKHGTYVFSILAARMPDVLIGSAPDAEFILLRTENDYSETHQEEDNWIAAAEYADSLGARIFTTSLGYYDFDEGEGDYFNSDLDGQTARITIAADIAASKGIVVVNSAGNAGSRGLNAPADGFDVLAIGAVDACTDIAGFSSRGPTADGRVKPDLVAMGSGNFFLDPSGSVRTGGGTSFSCPIISGLTACMLQAAPEAPRALIYDALKSSADRFEDPDNSYGYGLPDAVTATQALFEGGFARGASGQLLDPSLGYGHPFPQERMVVYPNPSAGDIHLAFESPRARFPALIEMYDLTGRLVWSRQEEISNDNLMVRIPAARTTGIFMLQVVDEETGARILTRNVSFTLSR
ncbi:S8 family serine peptidase [Pontibacter sp. G13]|uniref:S8 family serine peptidase n=1 Tax=Pontibacter sp. G13 TaxID=3074898 RepID=UPI00288A6827|nr:S8 family serine peptidase [Pontibacter sp. G13]WNJ17741.1 S8 family serine peptidase [Pontibacter sp. G13]